MVYLSNRCDMACRYCYVAVNQGEPRYLCAGQVRDAIDRFLELPHEHSRKIYFLGGEPLLRWSVLKASIIYGRKRGGPSLKQQISTNGLGLTPGKLKFLLSYQVDVILSLDGERESNDQNRVLHGRAGSVFERVMKRLDRLPKDRLGVNLVFTTRTLDRLLDNIDYFHRQGFRRLSFTPTFNEPWPPERLQVLRRVMDKFRRYYTALIEKGAQPFEIWNLYALLKREHGKNGEYWWQDCHNLVLGGDGGFYSCDKTLGFPFGRIKNSRIGSVDAGVDWNKRAADFKEASSFIAAHTVDANSFIACPMGIFFHHKILRSDPAQSLVNFEAVSKAYGRPLLMLARDLWAHPAFRKAHHIHGEVGFSL